MDLTRISTDSLAGRILRLPLRLIPAGWRMPILQGKMRGKKWIVGSSIHACWLGTYEYEQRLAFENETREGCVVFDIGAHVGFYTLLASVLVGPQGKVYAFEPYPRNVAFLKQHLALNSVANVELIEAAVSDHTGKALFVEGSDSGWGRVGESGKLDIDTVRLDDLLDHGRIAAPDVIKMDIEGGEFAALSGARRAVSQKHPVIFLSTHGNVLHEQCCNLLEQWGYELQMLDGKAQDERYALVARPRSNAKP